MSIPKRLFLLDAYALIYRAYYAFIRNPRVNSKGMNTSAIFGFTNTLLDILNKENPSHIAVAFDPPGPTFRHEKYPEYKANREKTPEDILNSVPYIKQIIEAMNIPIVEEYGYEADDVVGTIAKKAEGEGFEIYMVTPDKDYGQLVSDKIFMYKPGRGGKEVEIIGVKEICESFQVNNPENVVDVMGLWGDSSDNIPGAPGIGEKNAKKLINEFGTIENLFENSSQLKGKQQEIIKAHVDQIQLSKELVTIETNVPVKFRVEDFKVKEPNNNELKKIFEDLEFRSLIERMFIRSTPQLNTQALQGDLFASEISKPEETMKYGFHTISSIDHKYYYIDNKNKRKELIQKLLGQKEFCFDTETTGLDIFSLEIVGLSFCFMKNEAYYLPFPVNQRETEEILNEFKTVFENDKIYKIGQNIKYDIQVLKKYGIEVKGKLFDTMLAHYLLQPELRHNLNYLSEVYLKYIPVDIESLIGKKGRNQLSMRSVPADVITEYACEDADLAFQLKVILENELRNNSLYSLFENIEMPLVRVLADMEEAGFSLDINALNKYGEELTNELIQIESEIYKFASVHFNISSPKQLGEILFEKLKIETNAKTTKTKQYSTSEEVLIRLSDKHPIINKVLEFRSIKKLLSTYIEALPKLLNTKTNKIHTSFNQAITATGRLSSANPNLQNIPVREERGKEIRKSFIPSENNFLLSADYSQVELRLMAHMSNDAGMIEAFNNNEDIHASTAAKIFKVSMVNVTKEMRSKAKTANFGIIYGISSFGLSQRLNIPRGEAKELIDEYFQVFPKVKEYMDKSIQLARDKGYVLTIMGRRRVLPDINSRNATVRGFAERNAINAPIQGSAADIIKLAMINIHKKIYQENLKTKMILQVHDELIFDVPKSELDKIKIMVKEEMENTVKLSIPLFVDIGTGTNWLEAH